MTSRSPRPSGYADRPDYQVNVLRRGNRMTASIDGRVIASSDRALLVDEQDHALVAYFPREDVDIAVLAPVDEKTSHCPYKGDANYYALVEAPDTPVAWTYAEPYREVAVIADHIAFYQNLVDVRIGTRGS